jgi:ribosomal protein S18 acetylase RimI-like enzyme
VTILAFVPATGNVDHHTSSSTSSSSSSSVISSSSFRLGMFFADSVPSKKDDGKKVENDDLDDEATAASVTTSVLEETTDQTTRPSSSSSSTLSPVSVQLVMADSESFLNAAGSFLVDNFWLSSDHHQIKNADDITEEARLNLVVEQCSDLQDKYGQLLGSRLARSAVIGALDEETNELVGMVTLKETLLLQKTELLDSEKAEAIAKNAVAQLGPKQRRLYKNAAMSTIATELLSPDTQAVCVLSNLAVSKKARRRGVANMLCDEMEVLASDWDFDCVHLLVERDNTAARTLYEDKLGYKEVCLKESAPALRVDVDAGAFIETTADTLVLSKAL